MENYHILFPYKGVSPGVWRLIFSSVVTSETTQKEIYWKPPSNQKEAPWVERLKRVFIPLNSLDKKYHLFSGQ